MLPFKIMANIFTYGSLMFDRVWARVVKGCYASQSATLHGHQRLAVRGEDYPAAIPASQHFSITGVLYLSVSSVDIKRLDDFEGEYYLRLPAPVTTANGHTRLAETYILKPSYRHIAEPFAWDEEHFRTQGIERFLTRYQGFHEV
ncbi:gamma-glutamylcyclotransferase family protein [Candidatus Thiothrix sp. Deng01]|uniref:Putative gamma-glutamylcyclotransferase n=1 Tax=Candidatus Thiothrix phosphatis TaxID=3112415 RepID=A0ABU6CXA0_9GAMM|nr:gamma-glutamylcyclotransferase family protein [Candidatus Thiothrix sp. Deng01]MEB4591450.1 gamma-glutamylcyclotransferase family protein [Candidatus Thiothrix sp. Deng01]